MTLRHSFIVHQLKGERNQVELSAYLRHTEFCQALHYKKLLHRIQSGPGQLLLQPERKEYVKELNSLKTYPDPELLHELLKTARE